MTEAEHDYRALVDRQAKIRFRNIHANIVRKTSIGNVLRKQSTH